MNDNNLNGLLQQAQQAFQSGNLQQADTLFSQLVAARPHHAQILHFAGLTKSRLGDHNVGAQLLNRSITKQPHPMVYNNLGLILSKMKNYEEAIKTYKMAARMAIDFKDAIYNQGHALQMLERYKEASYLYNKLYRKNPNEYKAVLNLGIVNLQQGNYKSAEDFLLKATKLNDQDPKAWQNLAIAQDHWNKSEDSIASYTKCLQLNPENLSISVTLLSLLKVEGHNDAFDLLKKAMTQRWKNDPWLNFYLTLLGPVLYQSNDQIDLYRKTYSDLLHQYSQSPPQINPDILNNYEIQAPFLLHYSGRNETQTRKDFGTFYNNYLSKIPGSDKNKQVKKSGTPKIGFVVTAGHEGVFLKCMMGILNRWDCDRFETYIICSKPNGQAILQQKITNPNIKYVHIPKKIEEAKLVLDSIKLDLLHYWEVGTDSTNYFLPFLNTAPIQCTSWGWPLTSGIPSMDYFISSKNIEPENAQEHYTEKLALLDHLPTCYDVPEIPENLLSAHDLGLPSDKKLYACVQNIRKIHPDMDEAFAGILTSDDKSIIVILGDIKKGVTAALRKRLKPLSNTYPNRLFILPRQESAGYFGILKMADVVLDTFYYNGGANSVADLFAITTPYVTHQWEFHRGRYGAAAYHQAEISNAPICHSTTEYIKTAVDLANNTARRDLLVKEMKSKASKIFNTTQAVTELADFMEEAINSKRNNLSLTANNTKLYSQNGHSISDPIQEIKPIKKPSNKTSLEKEPSNSIPKDILDQIELLANEATQLFTSKTYQEAENILNEILALDPDNLDALHRMTILAELKNNESYFHDLVKRIRKTDKNEGLIDLMEATYIPTFVENKKEAEKQIIDLSARLDKIIAENKKVNIDLILQKNWFVFNKLMYYDAEVRLVKEKLASIFVKHLPAYRYKRKRTPKDKIKIGFLVTAGHGPIFLKSIKGIIKNIDKSKFEVCIISDPESKGPINAELKENITEYTEIGGDLISNVLAIYGMELDILMHWEVASDTMNYLLPFFRLAHKQCTSWGIPLTSGIKNVDYFISSEGMENTKSDDFYSEVLLKTTQPPVYYYNSIIPKEKIPIENYGLPADKNLYLCTQRLIKVQPAFDECLSGILEKDGNAIIVLIRDGNDYNEMNLKDRFAKRMGANSNRIFFMDKLKPKRYFGLHSNAKVALDTPVYCGANTTIDALISSVPVVSFEGKYQRGKFTEAAFRQMGFQPRKITTTEEYVEEAVKIGTDHEYRNQIVSEIEDKVGLLFEDKTVVTDFEKIFSEMLND